ncbi:response regulator [Arenibaculum pallidiluteum]|uniref:response regulator n=1 Tax=Arenibaculum pallidiluteum TaxID=2812559 RepID=UPI001A958C64|nr:response regulator [Arenibaculum pallidiluteum]
MRVLIAEDEPLTAATLACMLERAGYEVLAPVASVRAVLDQARLGAFDVALLDVELGPGGSGIAAARGLARHFGLPSLFVTAHAEKARAAADAALGVLCKPLDPVLLEAAMASVRLVLAGQSPQAAGFELFPGAALRPFRTARSLRGG